MSQHCCGCAGAEQADKIRCSVTSWGSQSCAHGQVFSWGAQDAFPLLTQSTCSPRPGKWSRQGSCLQQQSKLGHYCALVSPSATLGKIWISPGSPESLGRDLTVHGLFDTVIASVQTSKKIINSPVCSGLLHPNYRLVMCLLTWEMVLSPFLLDWWG